MKKLCSLALVAAVLGTLSFGALPAMAAASTGSALVSGFYDQLVDTMKQGEQLGFTGRFKKLEPVVKATFNLPQMVRFAVGPSWSAASDQDKASVADAFAAFSVANYASRFKKYDGEKFEVLGEKPASQGGVIVETRLTPKDGQGVVLNYLVRPDDTGALRIMDVYLDASISELATRRSDFSQIVKQKGLPALAQSLQEKTKNMENPKAKN